MPKKRKRGRPVTRIIEPIPDTVANIAQAIVRRRSKAEREQIIEAAREAELEATREASG